MSATDTQTDPLRLFVAELPPHARNRLNVTMAVVALVHSAVTNHGWPPRQLARECSRDLDGVVNAGAVVTDRLRKAATHPPPNQPARIAGAVLPFCSSDCRARGGWVEDATGRPVSRCPCRSAS